VETSRGADAGARPPPARDEPAAGARATLAPAAKPAAPPPTLREQLSSAAAAGDTPVPDPSSPPPPPAGSAGAAGDAALVSLALKVRTHGGAPYDARVPGVPLGAQGHDAPPAVVWCASRRAQAARARALPATAACGRRAAAPPCPPLTPPPAPTRRPGAFLGAAAAVAMALRMRAARSNSSAASSAAGGSEAGTPRSSSCASLDALGVEADARGGGAAGSPAAAAATPQRSPPPAAPPPPLPSLALRVPRRPPVPPPPLPVRAAPRRPSPRAARPARRADSSPVCAFAPAKQPQERASAAEAVRGALGRVAAAGRMRARPESSTLWRESFFVLTEPGRLHSFDSDAAAEPRGTLPVRGGSTAPHDTPAGFAVVGLGKALLFCCESEEEVRRRPAAPCKRGCARVCATREP
jgi:hypothetical protein